jgi:hypothetical protein
MVLVLTRWVRRSVYDLGPTGERVLLGDSGQPRAALGGRRLCPPILSAVPRPEISHQPLRQGASHSVGGLSQHPSR